MCITVWLKWSVVSLVLSLCVSVQSPLLCVRLKWSVVSLVLSMCVSVHSDLLCQFKVVIVQPCPVCVSVHSHLLCASLKWSLLSLVSSISAVCLQAGLISVCPINVFMLHPPPSPQLCCGVFDD